MSRKTDLEAHLRASYDLIREYEAIVRTSAEPKEKVRARQAIQEQWSLIEGYLAEYRRLASGAFPTDIAEIAAYFEGNEPSQVTPAPATPPTPGGATYVTHIQQGQGIAIGDGARVVQGEDKQSNYISNSVEMPSSIPNPEYHDEITLNSPMLMGLVFDLSRSVRRVLQENLKISADELSTVINLVVEKAIFLCKAPEAEEILPKFALFIYGYGFGNLRRNTFNFLHRIGLPLNEIDSTPGGPVRDLFAEVAAERDLPSTPNALILNTHRNYYKQSVEAQLADIGLGPSIFYESLCQVYERFRNELQGASYRSPLLMVVSDGQIADASFEDAAKITYQIQQLGVQIMHCYVDGRDITQSKTLYQAKDERWPKKAAQLFDLSSTISASNYLLNNIAKEARSKGWQVPEQARLFIQINQSEMLEEWVEILLSSLKD